jgi:predicted nucleic acid-binding protein
MIVLDTNVLSEVFRPLPSAEVTAWMAQQEPAGLFLTTITQAEILYGIEVLPAGRRRTKLADAVERVFAEDFRGRILPFDEAAAVVFPKIVAEREALGRPISQSDAMIAAIARSRHAVVATRNTTDFQHCGLRLVNPWTG